METFSTLVLLVGLAAVGCSPQPNPPEEVGKSGGLGDTPMKAGHSPLEIMGPFGRFDLVIESGGSREARATVAIFFSSDLVPEDDHFRLPDSTLEKTLWSEHYCQGIDLCDESRKALGALLEQPSGAVCSGVLITDDVVATANHCRGFTDTWASMSFVFGYTKGVTKISREQSYTGRLIGDEYMHGEDWALIRLDRKVRSEVAVPVSIRSAERDASEGAGVYSYGHHLGLPRLQSGDANATLHECIDHERKKYLMTDLDRFRYASGSPVFDSSTHELVGLLRKAPRDFYVPQDGNHCCQMYPSKPYTAAPPTDLRCSYDVIPVSRFAGAVPSPSE